MVAIIQEYIEQQSDRKMRGFIVVNYCSGITLDDNCTWKSEKMPQEMCSASHRVVGSLLILQSFENQSTLGQKCTFSLLFTEHPVFFELAFEH